MARDASVNSSVAEVGHEEPWWSGDSSHRSLLEIAAAAGVPVSTARDCGKRVCRQFERRYGTNALLPKELRGEPSPSRVYPAADVCWIQQLLMEHARKRAQQHREEATTARRCPCSCASSSTAAGVQSRGGAASGRHKRRLDHPQCECCTPGQARCKRLKASASSSTSAAVLVLLAHRIGSAHGPWNPAEAVELARAVPAAQINAADKDGCTAAYRLAKWGYRAAVAALADRGASLDARTRSGRTPLMAATLQCQVPVIQLLLTLRADLTVRDTAGHTALDHARQRVVDGWRRNCSVVLRFDAEAALHVLEGWRSRPMDVEPETEVDAHLLAELAEPQAHSRQEMQQRAILWSGVDAKAVIRGMRVRDAERMATARAKAWARQCATEPEPEPEGRLQQLLY